MAEHPEPASALSAISGVVDGSMTVKREANGVVAFQIRVGVQRDGVPSGDVVEVVVTSKCAQSIAQIVGGCAQPATVEDGGVAGVWSLPCHIGLGRRQQLCEESLAAGRTRRRVRGVSTTMTCRCHW
jgi:hypothetical protein